jgi:hypothetical protein
VVRSRSRMSLCPRATGKAAAAKAAMRDLPLALTPPTSGRCHGGPANLDQRRPRPLGTAKFHSHWPRPAAPNSLGPHRNLQADTRPHHLCKRDRISRGLQPIWLRHGLRASNNPPYRRCRKTCRSREALSCSEKCPGSLHAIPKTRSTRP